MLRKLGFFHFCGEDRSDPVGSLRASLIEAAMEADISGSLIVTPEAFNIKGGYWNPDRRRDPSIRAALNGLSREFKLGLVAGLIEDGDAAELGYSSAYLIDGAACHLLTRKMADDGSRNYRLFVRAADGTFTTFSAPNAGTGGYPYHQGTYSLSINKAGAIAGYYVDINGVSHGFAGTAAGAITSFDPPGSVGTYGESINAAGDIAGYYVDASAADHGFVRAADGSITTFDAPGGSTSGPRGTQAWSINAAGAVAGYYFKTNTLYRGFVRAPGGAITTFDVPGATVPGTMAVSINAAGTITGSYSDKKGMYRGFVRSASGAITTFSAPGADTLTGQDTHPASINDAGEIAGSYIDASDVTHGFLLK
jgi:hypothetical protein